MVKLFVLLFCLWSPARASSDVDMVKAFLKMPTAQMPAEHIPRFLAVPPESLPQKLRKQFQARCLELHTLKQIAAAKKRGIFTPEADCAVPKQAKGERADIMRLAGFEEIREEEERYVMNKTNCPEATLLCEFSLQIVREPAGQKVGAKRRLFLHQNDPLMALVAEYREGGGKQTHFFGLGGISCVQRGK